jgi:hypothetical protein
MFKVALKDKSCHLFKAYPKEEELAQMPEPGIFLKNNIPDSEHVRFFVTFDCKISQRTILRAIKSESVVEVTDFTCQEDPSTPVRNLVQAADRAALLLTSQPTEAVSTWMAALPTYSRELAERKADLEAENTIQPSNCSPVIKVGTPATVPRRSTSDSPFHANNAGKLHRNFQVTIGRQGGRDVVVTPDTTSPTGIRLEEPPHQALQPIIKPVDTEQLMAPTTEVPPNLQPFIMQILAAQQQLHPHLSRLHYTFLPHRKKNYFLAFIVISLLLNYLPLAMWFWNASGIADGTKQSGCAYSVSWGGERRCFCKRRCGG